jgi:LmbE family N-acetylglucosaminyl deacetylase
MKNKLLFSFLTLLMSFTIDGQVPERYTSSEIHDAIQKLNVLASVLYVAAHPDDENTRLIAYMANEQKARTAYLSLTRGDGGQNLIGPELRELLGVIRTQELLAARRVDGGEQRFTRANDFGYSKHPNETLQIWDRTKVLGDVVWAIRTFKPDIIINRFDHRTPGTTHGHHTSSAMLSFVAFDLAHDPTSYPEQLQLTETWKPQRLFFNTSWWFYGSQENFEKADKSQMSSFDIGVYYPSKGMSNNEIASLASSQHLCQGFGRLTTRGSQQEYIELLKGRPLPEDKDIFEGIDTSWNRVEGGSEIAGILQPIEANFNFTNPESHLPELLRAYQLIQNLKDEHWKAVKSKELLSIIEACTGLYLEASANTPIAAPEETIKLSIEAINRSNATITLASYSITSMEDEIQKNVVLDHNVRLRFEETITIPEDASYTTPYWLNKKGALGMYRVDDPELIGTPETPRSFFVHFNLSSNGLNFTISKPIVHRYSKPEKGELYRPFEIVPPVSAKLAEKVYLFETGKAQEVEVLVKADISQFKGSVSLAHPDDWEVTPQSVEVNIEKKGDVKPVKFSITPPDYQNEGLITPMVSHKGEIYTDEIIEIDYEHIPFQIVKMPSESKVVRLNIKKRGNMIGYIQGAGDVVPESLRQIGYEVTTIPTETISTDALKQFDAIVVGIRAYNVDENLPFKQKYLLEYVEKGGNLILQYNTSRGITTKDLGPYPLSLSRDRVTDENAEVRILNPEHPLLNYPNKITSKDFEGWVQERGLYFPDEWAEEYTPLLSINDNGETPKQGSLLVAQYGKGHYIYTGLSFFREFPAGVPGAYRLFANMLSAGKYNEMAETDLSD